MRCKKHFRLSDFKWFDVVGDNAYTATATVAKRTAVIIAVLVMIVRIAGCCFWIVSITVIACITARHCSKCKHVDHPYCKQPSHGIKICQIFYKNNFERNLYHFHLKVGLEIIMYSSFKTSFVLKYEALPIFHAYIA